MYFVGYTNYGLEIDISGELASGEAKKWRERTVDVLKGFDEPFGVLVDLRGAGPASSEIQLEVLTVIKACREAGMRRAAVLVDSGAVQKQSKRFTKVADVGQITRWFYDGETAEADATEWLKEGLS